MAVKTVEKVSKRDIVIAKAAELFSKGGYAGTSLRELADALDMEAPSLYNHIASKAELLIIICNEIAASFAEARSEASKKTTAEKAIEYLIGFHVNQTFSVFEKLYVADFEWKHLPSAEIKSYLAARKSYELFFESLISKGIDAGEFRKADAKLITTGILAALRGLEFTGKSKKYFTKSETAEAMKGLLLRGLKK